MIGNHPTISVVMPLYNKGEQVTPAVCSVLHQTVSDFELIVVNDGSTDKGPEVVRGITDSRIHLIEQENGGVSAARNRGIQQARGQLIAFIDADDEWKADFIETVLYLRGKFPFCHVFATNYLYHNGRGRYRLPSIRGLPRNFQDGVIDDYFRIASRSDPIIWSSAVAVTKEALETIGGFPVGIPVGEDLLTWARLAVRYNIAYSIRPCALFRLRFFSDEYHKYSANIPDFVVDELRKLIRDVPPPSRKSLQRYIGCLHRMRGSIFMQNGSTKEGLREIWESYVHSGADCKLLIMGILALMPSRLCMKINRKLYDFRKQCKNEPESI